MDLTRMVLAGSALTLFQIYFEINRNTWERVEALFKKR